jgi:hypothetical protein
MVIQELSAQEIDQVGGGDAWTNVAVVGGTVAAGIGGVFVAPAVAGAVFFAAGAYLVGFGVGSIYHRFASNTR